MISDTKTCKTCGKTQSIEAFYWANKERTHRRTDCKTCVKAYDNSRKGQRQNIQKKWYTTNRAHATANHKVYYQIHREEILEKKKEYYLLNAEHMKVESRKNYWNHREERKATHKKWTEAHKEWVTTYSKGYREQHGGELRAGNKQWRIAHAKELGVENYLKGRILKDETFAHYSGINLPRCADPHHVHKTPCFLLDVLELDHLKNNGKEERLSLGMYGQRFYEWLKRNNYPLGYQVLCANCHRLKTQKVLQSKWEYTPAAVKARQYMEKLKFECLSHYAQGVPHCKNCDEMNIVVLSVDHINGGGTQHLNKLGGGSGKLYRFLKQHDYPSGYRVLCMNCQQREKMRRNRLKYDIPESIQDVYPTTGLHNQYCSL